MKRLDITTMFANIPMPQQIRERIENEEYDDFQGWCCGLEASVDENGDVLVAEYCIKGRGSDKSLWRCKKDGTVEKVGLDRPAYWWYWEIKGSSIFVPWTKEMGERAREIEEAEIAWMDQNIRE